MRRTGDCLTRTCAALACAAALAAPAAAPAAAQGRLVRSLPLDVLEVSLVADTARGLYLLAEPAASARPARGEGRLVWLAVHPDSALEWVNAAAAAISRTGPGAAEGIQWSRVLAPLDGRGGLAIGRERRQGALAPRHWLAIGDSALGWRAELDGPRADSLLRLVLLVAGQARIDPAALDLPGPGDRPARPRTGPRPAPELRGGRAVLEFVVGTDGEVEPASIEVVIASGPGFAGPAREAIRRARFHPGERNGRPIRQRILHAVVWPPA